MWVWFLFVATALGAPLSADEAVEAALARSVPVTEAEAAVEAARGRLRVTGFLTREPTVAGSYAVLGDAMQVSAYQPVSLTGEGLAARKAARAELEAAEARLGRARLEAAAEVRRVWTAAVEARQRTVLASEAVALAERLLDAAERRLETGEASLLDARLARLEASEALVTWMAAVSEDGERTATLAALVGVSVDALELPDDPLRGAPRVSEALVERSDIAAARYELEAARAALAREKAGVLPPVVFGGFYEEEGDEVRAGPAVSVTVPLWRRNADGRAEARAELQAAGARLDLLERAAAAEIDASGQVLDRIGAAADRMDVDVPEEARTALESVAVGYEAGELDLLSAALLRSEILEGQRAWLAGRRLLAEARITRMLAREDPGLLVPAREVE